MNRTARETKRLGVHITYVELILRKRQRRVPPISPERYFLSFVNEKHPILDKHFVYDEPVLAGIGCFKSNRIAVDIAINAWPTVERGVSQ